MCLYPIATTPVIVATATAGNHRSARDRCAPAVVVGAISVRARASGAVVQHRSPGEAVTLRLPAGASLTGRVTGRGGRDKPEALVVATDRQIGASRELRATAGTFSLGQLPGGLYDLTAEGPDGTAHLEVQLREGESRGGLLLELRPRTTLRARLVDAKTGEAIEEVVWGTPWRRGGPFFPPPVEPGPSTGPEGRLGGGRAPRRTSGERRPRWGFADILVAYPEADVELVRSAVAAHSHLRHCAVEVKGRAIIVHEPAGAGRYTPVMMFELLFGEAEYFAARRRYSGDGGWMPLSGGPLAVILKKYVRHIGQDSFFEIY